MKCFYCFFKKKKKKIAFHSPYWIDFFCSFLLFSVRRLSVQCKLTLKWASNSINCMQPHKPNGVWSVATKITTKYWREEQKSIIMVRKLLHCVRNINPCSTWRPAANVNAQLLRYWNSNWNSDRNSDWDLDGDKHLIIMTPNMRF